MDKLKHVDAGVKIGGSRADKAKTVTQEELDAMSPEERERWVEWLAGEATKAATKEKIWPTPDYKAMVNGGCSVRAAAMVCMLRDFSPVKPTYKPSDTPERRALAQQAFTVLVGTMKSITDGVRTEVDISEAIMQLPEVKANLVNLSYDVSRGYRQIKRDPGLNFNNLVGSAFGPSGSYAASSNMRNALGLAAEGHLDAATSKMLRANPSWPMGTSKAEAWLRGENISAVKAASGKWTVGVYGRAVTHPGEQERLGENGMTECLEREFETKEEMDAALVAAATARGSRAAEAKSDKRQSLVDRALGKQEEPRDRVGTTWRHGAPATADSFIRDFGWRGVEYGKWVGDEKRGEMIEGTIDSFSDMMALFGLPREASSLGGSMAIGLGSRGHGHARAHYEPMMEVMNVTKPDGAGCLAHEWAHGLDHKLGRIANSLGVVDSLIFADQSALLSNMKMRPVGPDEGEAHAFIRSFSAGQRRAWETNDPKTKADMVESSEALRANALRVMMINAVNTEGHIRGSVDADTMAEYHRQVQILRTPAAGNAIDSVSQAMQAIMGLKGIRGSDIEPILSRSHVSATTSAAKHQENLALPEDYKGPAIKRKTSYYEACVKCDSSENKKDAYYAKPCEMFARTFEAMVADLLAEKGWGNQYLVESAKGMAFPLASDRAALKSLLLPLVRNLVEVIPSLALAQPPDKSKSLVAQSIEQPELALTS